jgi:hypothetical protein
VEGQGSFNSLNCFCIPRSNLSSLRRVIWMDSASSQIVVPGRMDGKSTWVNKFVTRQNA